MEDLRLRELVELENQVLYRTPPGPGEKEFIYRPGHLPVLLSAPHGAAHLRQGRLKREDEFTAALACWVAAKTGAQALYVHRQTHADHNYDRNTTYKLFMADLVREKKIQFVIDLHGASGRHPFGIALGTANGTSCTPKQRQQIIAILAYNGYSPLGEQCSRLDIDLAFPGGGGLRQETITAFCCRELGISAVQIEINAHMRILHRSYPESQSAGHHSDPALVFRLLNTLVDLTVNLANTAPRV
jgi:hypothetical protein